MHSIAIFGGTFDPVHQGHIQTSKAIQVHFKFDSFYFLPCKIPAIKPPALASNSQRVEMLELALKPYPDFDIDLREIKRDSPSYMVETLQSFRLEHATASITLIMGYDAFMGLSQWYQWEKITELANLLIINRQCSTMPLPEPIKKLIIDHQNDNEHMIKKKKSGVICFFNAGNYDISSTELRKRLGQHHEVIHELPKEVNEYIKRWGLYQ